MENITMNDINYMVNETIIRIIKESLGQLKPGTKIKVPSGFNSQKYAKAIAKQYNVEPEDFRYDGISLIYTPIKKKPISKPEGMSDEEYEKKYIIPNNPKYREALEEYPDEEFRPLVNGGRYYGGETEYGDNYEVSNKGRIKIINHANVLRSRIIQPNNAETKKGAQAHIKAYDETEGRLKDTCSNVAYMVANAFLGEHNPSEWVVKHIDGDWRNNNVENLEWVQSKNAGKFGKFEKN